MEQTSSQGSTDSAPHVTDDTESNVHVAKLQKQMLAFGGARTPLEQQIDKERIVVAGPQIFSIPNEWSFQEFLIYYGRAQLGKDWIIANTQILGIHLKRDT